MSGDAYERLEAAVAAKQVRGVRVDDEAARIRDLPWADYEATGVVDAAVAWATERWSRGPQGHGHVGV